MIVCTSMDVACFAASFILSVSDFRASPNRERSEWHSQKKQSFSFEISYIRMQLLVSYYMEIMVQKNYFLFSLFILYSSISYATVIEGVFAEGVQLMDTSKGETIKKQNFFYINNDSIPDLIVEKDSKLYWYPGYESNVDTESKEFSIDLSEERHIRDIDNKVGTEAYLNFLDVNDDGHSDLVSLGSNENDFATLDVYFNDGLNFSEKYTLATLPSKAYDNFNDYRYSMVTFEIEDKLHFVINAFDSLLIYKLNTGEFELLSEISTASPILTDSISICDINNNGVSNIVYRTSELTRKKEKRSNLYSIEANNLTTPSRVYGRYFYSGAGSCRKLGNKSSYVELITYSDASMVKEVSIVNGELNLKDITRFFKNANLFPKAKNVKTFDFNNDGYDDLIFQDYFNNLWKVATFNPNNNAFYATSNRCESSCKVSFVDAETPISFTLDGLNRLQFSLFTEDYLNSTSNIYFAAQETIEGIDASGEFLKVITSRNAGDLSARLVKFKQHEHGLLKSLTVPEQLTDPFQSSFAHFDWNNDGLLDLFYSELDDSSEHVTINIFEATETGYLAKHTLNEIPLEIGSNKSFEKIAKIHDINNDGEVEYLLESSTYDSTDQDWYRFDSSYSSFSYYKSGGQMGHARVGRFKFPYVDLTGDDLVDDLFIEVDWDGVYWDPEFYQSDSQLTGWLSYRIQNQDGTFSDNSRVDEIKYDFWDYQALDVTQSGLKNIVTSERYFQNEGYLYNHYWYELSEDSFVRHALPSFEGYLSVFNTNKDGYFIDLDFNEGLLTEYVYSEELKQPVVNRTIFTGAIKEVDDAEHFLFDFDKDGDLDIYIYTNTALILYENLGL